MGIDFPYSPQIAGFGGDLAGGGDAPGGAVHGSGEEEWEGGGGRGPARAQVMRLSRQPAWRDKPLVAPAHVARQRCHVIAPSALPWRSAAPSANMAALSHHMHWRDRGYLSRQVHWRDQTGYVMQINLDTGEN